MTMSMSTLLPQTNLTISFSLFDLSIFFIVDIYANVLDASGQSYNTLILLHVYCNCYGL